MQTVKLIKRYSYRSANVNNRFLTIPREWVESLEKELCRQAGSIQDNHVTFEFEFNNDHGFCNFELYTDVRFRSSKHLVVLFHDFIAIFGTEVEEKEW